MVYFFDFVQIHSRDAMRLICVSSKLNRLKESRRASNDRRSVHKAKRKRTANHKSASMLSCQKLALHECIPWEFRREHVRIGEILP